MFEIEIVLSYKNITKVIILKDPYINSYYL